MKWAKLRQNETNLEQNQQNGQNLNGMGKTEAKGDFFAIYLGKNLS